MITLSRMNENSVKSVAAAEKECFSSPWSEEGIRAELSDKTAFFLIAENDGEFAGYCGMHCICGECYIANVAVLPKFRRMGVGRALVSGLISHAAEINGEFISLEVRLSNLSAIALYENLGFKRCGERRDFYSNPRENALIMTKNLKGCEILHEDSCN